MSDILNTISGKSDRSIDFSIQKITEDELYTIGFILSIELCITKSIHKCKDLMKVLDYYEFEDEQFRLDVDKIRQNIISSFLKSSYIFTHTIYRTLFNLALTTHLQGSETLENDLLIKHLPENLTKSPFIKLKVSSHKHINPYFEVGTLKLDWVDAVELFDYTPSNSLEEKLNQACLNAFSKVVSVIEDLYFSYQNLF